MSCNNITVGVLAVQGAFIEHIEHLKQLGVNAIPIRTRNDLTKIDGLIIPGGESTSMGIICSREQGFMEDLEMFRNSRPVWGTCAGMIFLADSVTNQKNGGQVVLKGLHCNVNRNHFGAQRESFETFLKVPQLGEEPIRAVFIRAPVVTKAEDGVSILAKLSDDEIVAVQQGNILATAFHPELSSDTRYAHKWLIAVTPNRWHKYFVDMIQQAKTTSVQ